MKGRRERSARRAAQPPRAHASSLAPRSHFHARSPLHSNCSSERRERSKRACTFTAHPRRASPPRRAGPASSSHSPGQGRGSPCVHIPLRQPLRHRRGEKAGAHQNSRSSPIDCEKVKPPSGKGEEAAAAGGTGVDFARQRGRAQVSPVLTLSEHRERDAPAQAAGQVPRKPRRSARWA